MSTILESYNILYDHIKEQQLTLKSKLKLLQEKYELEFSTNDFILDLRKFYEEEIKKREEDLSSVSNLIYMFNRSDGASSSERNHFQIIKNTYKL